MNTRCLYLSICTLFISISSWGQSLLQSPVAPPLLDEAVWSLCIQDADSGTTLIDVRSHHMLTPASTLKLLSTGTYFSLFSPDDRIETKIMTDGKITNGVLKGNLYLVGGGDPSIRSRYMSGSTDLFGRTISALRQKGIRSITGKVIAYSPKEDSQGVNPHWPYYDLGNYYAAGAYDLNAYDNSYGLTLSNYGRSFKVYPNVSDMKIHLKYERSNRIRRDSLYIQIRPDAVMTRDVTGAYPINQKSRTIRGSIPNPPLFVAQHLQKRLVAAGISVSGGAALSATLPQNVETLYVYQSPTLNDIITVTNAVSHNLFAESIMKLIGREVSALPGESLMERSIRRTRAYWEDRGLPSREADIFDGCGLSQENKISTYFLASMLGKIYRADPDHQFMKTLPVAGVNGTVEGFLKGTPLEGIAHLKSGTIHNVVSYAGYVRLNGKVYTMAVIVNNYPYKARVMRRAVKDLLLQVFNVSSNDTN